MPRIRSLKYEYFINEDLAQISSDARLLGLGLTTLADREGRLEDRPLRIKVLLFPYHDVDVDAAINALQTAGFLERYTFEGKRYIRIVNFLKHQKPHPRETPSVLPDHEKVSPRRAKAGPAKQKQTEQVDPSRRNGLGDLGTSVSGNGSGSGQAAQARGVFEFWQQHLDHPQAILTPIRERAIVARLKEGYTLAQLENAIRGCKKSPHNMGRNDRHTKFDDIELICRDSTKLERFISIEENGEIHSGVNNRKPTASERRVETLRANAELVREDDRPDDYQEPTGRLVAAPRE